jgi:hypothetical protein
LKKIRKIAKIIWASPYSMLGLCIGVFGLVFGCRSRFSGKSVEFYGGGVRWLIHQLPNGQFTHALTLGHVVLGQDDSGLEIQRNKTNVYISQYERWGPFLLPAYYLASVFAWLRGRRFYRDNPFERQAIEAERLESEF